MHTKGPWIVIPKSSGFADVTISGPAPDDVTRARYMPIATVHTYKNEMYPCFYEVTEEERDANARLMAAAPELLEHVKKLTEKEEEDGYKELTVVKDAQEFLDKLLGSAGVTCRQVMSRQRWLRAAANKG